MRVTVVGSGDAFNAEGRLHSCYLLEGSKLGPTMVDFGGTALAGLRRVGRRPAQVSTFTFTHLHGDHIGGLPFLVVDSLFSEPRKDPLRLVGPVGLKRRVEALLDATYGVEVLRRRDTLKLEMTEIRPGQRSSVDGFELEAFAADHQDPPDIPLCLRFTGPDGRSVAFSGDTQMCAGLLAAAEGVDILIAECSALSPPAGRHCTWEDWVKVLPNLSARRVVLTHLGESVRRSTPRLLAEAPPGPRLDFADDGLVLDLLPGPA